MIQGVDQVFDWRRCDVFMRIFRARVRPGKHEEFKKALEILALPNIQHRKGMVAFYPGQPTHGNPDEFILVTIWRDAELAEKYSRDADWARAIIPPEVLPLIQEFHVHTYQAFGVPEQSPQPLFQTL
jgi:quinol monooxygenase YgiN